MTLISRPGTLDEWLECDGCGRRVIYDHVSDRELEPWDWFPVSPKQDNRLPWTKHYCGPCQQEKPYRDAFEQCLKERSQGDP